MLCLQRSMVRDSYCLADEFYEGIRQPNRTHPQSSVWQTACAPSDIPGLKFCSQGPMYPEEVARIGPSCACSYCGSRPDIRSGNPLKLSGNAIGKRIEAMEATKGSGIISQRWEVRS